MSPSPVVHDTFVIERSYPVPPARVFEAFASDERKRRWFLLEEGTAATDSYENDFRVGGKETSRFRFTAKSEGGPPPGTVMGNDTVYLDIVENERIVFAYAMLVGDYRMSVSLATIELVPEGGGTRLVFTEQGAFFEKSDGLKLRKEGWGFLLAKLASAIS